MEFLIIYIILKLIICSNNSKIHVDGSDSIDNTEEVKELIKFMKDEFQIKENDLYLHEDYNIVNIFNESALDSAIIEEVLYLESLFAAENILLNNNQSNTINDSNSNNECEHNNQETTDLDNNLDIRNYKQVNYIDSICSILNRTIEILGLSMNIQSIYQNAVYTINSEPKNINRDENAFDNIITTWKEYFIRQKHIYKYFNCKYGNIYIDCMNKKLKRLLFEYIETRDVYSNISSLAELLVKLDNMFLFYIFNKPEDIKELLKFLQYFEFHLIKNNNDHKKFIYEFTRKYIKFYLFKRMPTYHYKHYEPLIGLEYFWNTYYKIKDMKSNAFISITFITRYILHFLLENEKNNNDVLLDFKRQLNSFVLLFLNHFKNRNYKKVLKILYNNEFIFTKREINKLNMKLKIYNITYNKTLIFIDILRKLLLYLHPRIISIITNVIDLNMCNYNLTRDELLRKYFDVAVSCNKIFMKKNDNHFTYKLKLIFIYLNDIKFKMKYNSKFSKKLEKEIRESKRLTYTKKYHFMVDIIKYNEIIHEALHQL
ncbi:hypothetical protein TCON_1678 [Astathelohania contejeani]|uniref:Uncharacterized protein n=1 Tax=Astathelohania contejeani TaxID=164912 RepID=A0ABQ7HYC8_9MICR|nr:hypothetical protein TCON_1678 [Thelohania contejeani]